MKGILTERWPEDPAFRIYPGKNLSSKLILINLAKRHNQSLEATVELDNSGTTVIKH